MAKRPGGHVLYEGPSLIAGESDDIAVVITYHSSNSGTGNIPQVWVMLKDHHPVQALRESRDSPVCGSCPLSNSVANKAKGGGGCYVNTMFVASVWRAYKNGVYPSDPSDRELKRGIGGRIVRLGAYGDPTAFPIELARRIVGLAAGNTGYTHQWATCDPAWRHLIMASVETTDQAHRLRHDGWRTFRVMGRHRFNRPGKGEILCPKDDTVPEHRRKTCLECGACDGFSRAGQVSVVIHGHQSPVMQKTLARSLAILQ